MAVGLGLFEKPLDGGPGGVERDVELFSGLLDALALY